MPTTYGKDYMRIYVIYNEKSYKYIPEKNILQFIQSNVSTSIASTQGWVGKSRCVVVIVADLNAFPFYVSSKKRRFVWPI